MSSFQLPSINTNASGWGPQQNSNIDKSLHILLPPALNHNVTSSNIVTSLKTLICDWTAPTTTTTTSHHRSTAAASAESQAEKTDSFTVVAHQTSSTPSFPSASAALSKRKNAWAVQREHAQSQQKTYTMEQQKQIHRTLKKSGAGAGAGGANRGERTFTYGTRQQKEAHQAQLYRTITTSIAVQPDWDKVATFAFKDLESMNLPEEAIPKAEDVKICGELESYDKKFDRITTKTPCALKSTNRAFVDVTTTEDPVLNNMSGENDAVTLFATDQLLALLIAASRTVYPWDLVFRKVGNNIYLDKRQGIPMIDLLTVNENSVRDAPSIEDREKKNMNSANVVTLESATVNKNFSQFVLNQKGNRVPLSNEPNPFASSEEEVAPVGYRYRKWRFNDNLFLVARCEIDAVVDAASTDKKFVSVKTLTEYHGAQTPTNWRGRLDTQRSAVLLTEYKNNAAKMTRFTAQAILSGVDQMKVGFVTRAGPTTIKQHHILGVETYIPSALARTVKLSSANMWGVIQGVVGVVSKQEGDGVFVLLHPPNKQQLDLYKIHNEEDLAEPSESGDEEEEEINEDEE